MILLKMIPLSLFFALFLIGTSCTSSTIAQTMETNLTEEQKEDINKNVEEYAAALDLSEVQRPKFEDITKKYAKQMKALRDSDERARSKFKKQSYQNL